MVPAIKFCGLTRPADSAFAAELGASYVGVVFAESPRRLSPDAAREVYAAAASVGASRPVAVFGRSEPGEIAAAAAGVEARVVQLHGRPDAATVRRLREMFDGEVWAVVRTGGGARPPDSELMAEADGVVLDTADARLLGGTGRSFDWEAAAESLLRGARPRKLVLAGGLRPSNVGDAIRLLMPDVVDVSSGVESSTGIKDHALMRAFVEAVGETGHR